MKKLLASLSLTLLVSACGGDATKLTPTTYSAIDGWSADQHASAYKLFTDSCTVNMGKEKAYKSKLEGPVGVRQNWNRVCTMAEGNPQPSDDWARQFFENNFTPYKVETESKATGTLTGYYEPILKGSRTKQGKFTTPVYGVPSDLGSRKPYYTREEIERGAIRGKAPVLLYVDDPVMLFFLHIQGSGKVQLPDGSLVGLQYAAQNGQQFFPIGKLLKERGDVPNPSMQGIRDWLRANPAQADEVMNTNPSYVFFKLSPGSEMAKGAQGIPLTPLRSVAIDDDRAAYGVPTFIDTYKTDYDSGSQVPLQRLFVSQDTGGALHSPHRGDLFFGRGEREEWEAGHQNAQGNVYWLLPVNEGVMLRDGEPLTDKEKAAAIKAAIPAEAPAEPIPPVETPGTDLPPAEPLEIDAPADAADPSSEPQAQ